MLFLCKSKSFVVEARHLSAQGCVAPTSCDASNSPKARGNLTKRLLEQGCVALLLAIRVSTSVWQFCWSTKLCLEPTAQAGRCVPWQQPEDPVCTHPGPDDAPKLLRRSGDEDASASRWHVVSARSPCIFGCRSWSAASAKHVSIREHTLSIAYQHGSCMVTTR